MTDTPEDKGGSAAAAPEMMGWDSRTRRVVLLYVPLACFVFILLFPFYWMAVTAFKPNAELYDYRTYNPSSDTFFIRPGVPARCVAPFDRY